MKWGAVLLWRFDACQCFSSVPGILSCLGVAKPAKEDAGRKSNGQGVHSHETDVILVTGISDPGYNDNQFALAYGGVGRGFGIGRCLGVGEGGGGGP